MSETPNPPSRGNEPQNFAADFDDCVAEIRGRQCRLGTEAEQTDDMRIVCELLHRLNNVRAKRLLERELGRLSVQRRLNPNTVGASFAI